MTTIATSIQHESDSDDGHHDEDCGWLLLLFSRPQSHVARTHALDKALDAGEEDCNQLPRRNLLEQHRAAAALEARLRARRKGPAASYTHQEPSPRRPVRGCRDECCLGSGEARRRGCAGGPSADYFDQLLRIGHESSSDRDARLRVHWPHGQCRKLAQESSRARDRRSRLGDDLLLLGVQKVLVRAEHPPHLLLRRLVRRDVAGHQIGGVQVVPEELLSKPAVDRSRQAEPRAGGGGRRRVERGGAWSGGRLALAPGQAGQDRLAEPPPHLRHVSFAPRSAARAAAYSAPRPAARAAACSAARRRRHVVAATAAEAITLDKLLLAAPPPGGGAWLRPRLCVSHLALVRQEAGERAWQQRHLEASHQRRPVGERQVEPVGGDVDRVGELEGRDRAGGEEALRQLLMIRLLDQVQEDLARTHELAARRNLAGRREGHRLAEVARLLPVGEGGGGDGLGGGLLRRHAAPRDGLRRAQVRA
mmetsp:Transcript_12205/g.40864  ORF Transcript_12205/g.40864 Transcript_12205/m.40864 type:complete len:478 (+) Transcript_12205:698-2131(+)